MNLRTWLRWCKNGRPRWCSGIPNTVDGVMNCGCVWDVGLMVSLCDFHEHSAREAGLVLRNGDLEKEGS